MLYKFTFYLLTYLLTLCDTGDVDYVDRYRHIHGSKPVMIPVDQLVIPREGKASVDSVPSKSKLFVSYRVSTGLENLEMSVNLAAVSGLTRSQKNVI